MSQVSTIATAPGKLILCGEHAVVYGRPAIALPLHALRAQVMVMPGNKGDGLRLVAPDLGQEWRVDADHDHPLSVLVLQTLERLGQNGQKPLDLTITPTSEIPVAAGLGSGAAVATALVRALADYMGQPLPPEEMATLVYSSEERLHGTPSGIDNTVIAFERAIWFERGMEMDNQPEPTIEPVDIGAPFRLVVGDTGERSPTHRSVGEVRRRWQADPGRYEELFYRIDSVVRQIRIALASDDITSLGLLINENQELLEAMGVSSPALERLVAAAQNAGAWGAKLSGGGWGGVMLALVDETTVEPVVEALAQAGAVRVLTTQVP